MAKQKIAVWQVGLRAIQNQLALESGLCRRRRRLTTMIRLRRASSHQCVRPLLQRIADKEFQLTRLVAAERESGLIVFARDRPAQQAPFAAS